MGRGGKLSLRRSNILQCNNTLKPKPIWSSPYLDWSYLGSEDKLLVEFCSCGIEGWLKRWRKRWDIFWFLADLKMW